MADRIGARRGAHPRTPGDPSSEVQRWPLGSAVVHGRGGSRGPPRPDRRNRCRPMTAPTRLGRRGTPRTTNDRLRRSRSGTTRSPEDRRSTRGRGPERLGHQQLVRGIDEISCLVIGAVGDRHRPAADLDDRQSGAPGRARSANPTRSAIAHDGRRAACATGRQPRHRRHGGRMQGARTGPRRRPRRRGCAGSMPRARRLQPGGVGRRRRDRPGRRAVRPSRGALPRWPVVSTALGPSPAGCRRTSSETRMPISRMRVWSLGMTRHLGQG